MSKSTELGTFFGARHRELARAQGPVIHVSVAQHATDDREGISKYDASKPFASCEVAKAAATSGDTVIVEPGSYTLTSPQLGKDGVNWHFEQGAKVYYASNGDPAQIGVIDDSATGANGVLRCSVTGHGEFYWTLGDTTGTSISKGVVFVTNASSDVVFECDSIEVINGAGTGNYMSAVSQMAGRLVAVARKKFGASTQGYAVWWANGDCRVFAPDLNAPKAIKAVLVAGTMTGSLWVDCQSVTGAEYAIDIEGDNAAAKIYVNAAELSGQIVLATGKSYITVGKLFSSTRPIAQTGGKLWLTAQKITISAEVEGQTPPPSGWARFSGSAQAWLDVMNWEDEGEVVIADNDFWDGGYISVNDAAKVFMRSTVAVTASALEEAGAIVAVHGGQIYASGRFDSSDSSGLVGFYVEANGLTLDGATVIVNAAADSLKGDTSRNVNIHGTSVANKAKNANITLKANTSGLIVSADVQ